MQSLALQLSLLGQEIPDRPQLHLRQQPSSPLYGPYQEIY